MTYRLGILGYGSIVQGYHLPAARGLDGLEVVGLAGHNLARAQSVADQAGVAATGVSVEDLLGLGLDGLVIATVPSDHEAAVLAAAAAGIDLLCEKPLALDVAASARMLAATGSVHALTGLTLRWTSGYRALRRFLQQAPLGELYHLELLYANGSSADPSRWKWHYDTAQEPLGVLSDLGPHPLDLIRWLVGEVATVSAQATTAIRYRGEQPVSNPDTASLKLGLAASALGSDISAQIITSRIYPPPDGFYAARLDAWGERGWLRYDATQPDTVLLQETGASPRTISLGIAERSFDDLLLPAGQAALSDLMALGRGELPRADLPYLSDGHQIQLLLDAITTSLAEQRLVEIATAR